MHGISACRRTPSSGRVPYFAKTPPGAGISIRAVCCCRIYRLAAYFAALVTTYNM